MTNLLIRKFLRSNGPMIGLLILFFCSLVSLHNGKLFLDLQAEIEEKTAEFHHKNLEKDLRLIGGEIGLLPYYIRFGLDNETPRLSGLTNGNWDIQPDLKGVNIRNILEKKHRRNLENPVFQIFGNLDFSIVLIYLFPLIIITFCFNLLSEEKEDVRWKLMLSQSENPLKIIQTKLFIRLVCVFVTFFALLVISKIYLEIPLDTSFLAFSSTGVLYLLFWFSLAWFITSLQKSSRQNAMIFLSVWVALMIIIPTATNALVVNLFPIPAAYETILQSREGLYSKWDGTEEQTINKFRALREKLHLRDKFSRTIGCLFPSMHTQFTLNRLSRSDLKNHLNFLNTLEDFHEKRRLNFYPKILKSQPIKSENWSHFGLEYFKDERPFDWFWFACLSPLAFISLLLLLLSMVKWSKINMG